MFRLFIFMFFLLLSFVSCNNNDNITPIRTRKIAPKVSSVFKSDAYNLRIKYIILHYTALNDDLSLKVLTDPGVSSHYLITTREDDPIYKLVDDNNRAWHAGVTMYDNRHTMNDTSIGIEIVNLGFLHKKTNTYEELKMMTKIQRENLFFIPYDEYIEYKDNQIEKLVYLLNGLIKKYGVKPYNILGHSDIAPYRKKDPGPKFPWKRLYYEYNLGIWYDEYDYTNFLNDDEYNRSTVLQIKDEFVKYGYTSMPTNNVWDFDSRKVLYAFQCHFRPEKIDGNIDNETYAIIRALNQKVKKLNEMEERSKANNFLTNTFFTNIFISNNIISTNWHYNTNSLLKRR